MKANRPTCILALGISTLLLLTACTLQSATEASQPAFVTPPTITNNLQIASLTPAANPTAITPALTPQVMIEPSQTAKPAATIRANAPATFTPYPTFVPVTPNPNAGAYRLKDWSLESAAELVALAENSVPVEPAEISNYEQLTEFSNVFNAAAAALSIAYQEALLRAPTNPLSDTWQRKLVYSQAANQSVDADAFNNYMTGILTKGEVSFQNLELWLSRNFTKPPQFPFEFELTTVKVNLPATFSDGYMVQLKNGWMGAVCSVLVKDGSGYRSYTLTNSFLMNAVDALWHEVTCQTADLTGDEIDEIMIVYTTGGHLVDQEISVFSLDQWPPRRIALDPEIAITNDDVWPSRYYFDGVVEKGLQKRLSLNLWPSSWDCYITTNSYYQWNGLWVAQVEYGPTNGDAYGSPYCADNLDLPLTPLKLRGAFLARFLEAQPGSDMLRYQLGVQKALAGDSTQSVQVLEELLAAPSDPQDEWVQKARRFLAVYISAEQIYRACQSVPDCIPGEALAALARSLPPERLARSPEYFKEAGVPVLDDGFLPGSATVWLTVRWPGKVNPELWLVEANNDGLSAVLVSELTGNISAINEVDRGAPDGFTLFQAADVLFLYAASPNGGTPYVQCIFANGNEPETDQERFEQLSGQLLRGGDPSLLLAEMRDLRQKITFDAQELYFYGLAAELAGRPDDAVNAYWQAWQAFPEDLIANLARYKLELLP